MSVCAEFVSKNFKSNLEMLRINNVANSLFFVTSFSKKLHRELVKILTNINKLLILFDY